MTKQEEIREVIDAHTDDVCLYQDSPCEFRGSYGYCISTDDAYKCLMKRLSEIGVVIKVDRELPESCHTVKGEHAHGYYEYGQEDMLKAGYVAVEPLIKQEERNDREEN